MIKSKMKAIYNSSAFIYVKAYVNLEISSYIIYSMQENQLYI